MVEFGDRLKSLRKQKNLTQKQLADLVGVKNSIISFYEVGDRLPSLEIVKKLAAVLHVSTDYLLGFEKNNSVDVSGLDENDIKLVRSLIDTLRDKNQRIQKESFFKNN
ncbi:MAG: helix-turn-helix domain-containing protein [Butyrivibrio sp.]